MSRSYEIRKAASCEDMGAIYSAIDVDNFTIYSLSPRGLFSDPPPDEGGDSFPHNIQEHFWVGEDSATGNHKIAVGQLTNGAYFLFTGGDKGYYGDFKSMDLWLSWDWKSIVEEGMYDRLYDLYVAGTSA